MRHTGSARAIEKERSAFKACNFDKYSSSDVTTVPPYCAQACEAVLKLTRLHNTHRSKAWQALSGGLKRRLALAVELVGDPEILLLGTSMPLR
jgi:ATPase subunit of ABC transporter with duplicated ATPase domains